MALKLPKSASLTVAHKRSGSQERLLAKRIGGERVSGSGSRHVKGDVRKRGIVRVECKNTTANSFRVTMDMLEKLETHSAGSGELPVVSIEFIDGCGRVIKSCCVVPSYVLDIIAGDGNEE